MVTQRSLDLPSGQSFAQSPVDWRQTLVISTLLILIIGVFAVQSLGTLTGFFFLQQDLAVGLAIAALLMFCALTCHQGPEKSFVLPPPRILLVPGIIALIFGGWLGHFAVMHGYSLSRDEQMAVHDAVVFGNGQFAAPLPKVWHEMADILNRNFNSTKLRWDLTVSGYRPVNALLHMLMMKVGLLNLTSPIMSAIGLFAMWRVARRIWPTDQQIQSLSILFYICSAQIWAASMTTYAMSALLALNMVWLALFLRRDTMGYVLALIIGFFAVGVHQVPYHPLFAIPFVALLFVERRWTIFALYAVSYLAFVLFWLRYEDFVSLAMGGGALKIESATIGTTILSHVGGERAPGAASFTAANVFRFLSWQHFLILPLFLVATKVALRDRNWLLMAMITACVLPIVVKFMQAPYQGHGWGYRYVHGVIGLTCILAAVGWRELGKHSLANGRNFVLTTVLTVAIVLPWHLWNASKFSGGYAQVDKQLSALKTDFVVVDALAAPFAGDLVNNRADLSNRPLRLLAAPLTPDFVTELCKRGTITLFPTSKLAPVNAVFGLKTLPTTDYKAVENNFRKDCSNRVN